MNEDLKDFELEQENATTPMTESAARTLRWPYIVLAVALILVAIAFIFYRKRASETVEEPAAAPAAVAEAPAEPGARLPKLEIGEVPALVDSDRWIRGLAHQLSTHPQLAEWLLSDEIIRTFVVAVDNIAEGKSPSRHLGVMRPEKTFGTREEGERVVVDAASYHRYDLLVDVVESLDTAGLAELYGAIRPLLEQAYRELGYPAVSFEDTLRRAIHRLLAAPVIEAPIELEARVNSYHYADPTLEELSPATKQFLRLGPQNLERLQAKVRQVARALGLV